MALAALVATAVSVGLALASAPGSKYRYAPLFLAPLVWGVFFIRRWLHLHPLRYVLFLLAVLLHNLGARGYYQRQFFGLWFDAYVHGYFGFVGGLLLHRFIRHEVRLGPWQLRVATVMFVMGLGVFHELFEWATTWVAGPDMQHI